MFQGTNLTSAQENGNLVFIEGLKFSIEGLKIPNNKNEMHKDMHKEMHDNPFVGLG